MFDDYLGPTQFKDCPTCGQRMALVGAEWWHERSYVEGVHPRDCILVERRRLDDHEGIEADRQAIVRRLAGQQEAGRE